MILTYRISSHHTGVSHNNTNIAQLKGIPAKDYYFNLLEIVLNLEQHELVVTFIE